LECGGDSKEEAKKYKQQSVEELKSADVFSAEDLHAVFSNPSLNVDQALLDTEIPSLRGSGRAVPLTKPTFHTLNLDNMGPRTTGNK